MPATHFEKGGTLMSGESTSLQKSAIEGPGRAITRADALFMAEHTQLYVSKRLTPIEQEVRLLREQLSLTFEMIHKLSETYGQALVEMAKLKGGGLDEIQVDAAIKRVIFQHESKTMQALSVLERQMRDFQEAPILEWRGPHKVGEEHLLGDVVQRDSRTFVCTVPRTKETPGKSAHFRQICYARGE